MVLSKKNIPLYTYEIIFRPQTWRSSFEKLVKVLSHKSSSKENLDYSKSYTLLSIGVSSLYQGKGVAKQLEESFELMIKEFTNKYSLSVKETNLKALRFYEKNGFKLERNNNGLVRFIKEI